MSEIKAGDKVVYTNQEKHDKCPAFYPVPGTIGTVISMAPTTALVQWPAGATDDDGEHYSNICDIKPYQLQFDPEAFKRGEFAVKCNSEQERVQFMHLLETLCPGTDLWYIRSCNRDNGGVAYYFQDGSLIGLYSVFDEMPVFNFSDIKIKEETMNNTEKLADLERRSREVADKIKALREQPRFTLEGFLRGDFVLSFATDVGKATFLGWLNGKSEILWANGILPAQFYPEMNFIRVEQGRMVQGRSFTKPTIHFNVGMLSETPTDTSSELKALEAELRQIADEMAALKKEMEKPVGYPKPTCGDDYYLVSVYRSGAVAVKSHWDNDPSDNVAYESGNVYSTKAEAQRVADMMNYFFLVQKKARQAGGLLGYGHDVEPWKDGQALLFGTSYFSKASTLRWSEQPPLQPILTAECAAEMLDDPEVIASAKKAWGVK